MENIVRKGEICYKQFLLFLRCFQQAYIFSVSKFGKLCGNGFNVSNIWYNRVNPSPNDKFLDWSKLKALADDKINVTEKLKFIYGRVGNIVGKGENGGY